MDGDLRLSLVVQSEWIMRVHIVDLAIRYEQYSRGYIKLIYGIENNRLNIFQRTILIGFLVLFGGGYAHQTYAFLFYQRERPYSALENALYASLHRVTFPMGVAWIVITHFIQRFSE